MKMENVKNSLVLFDVDGTLTEPRQRINKDILISLRELSFVTEIGLLTGSNLEYIKEQLWPLLADPELSLQRNRILYSKPREPWQFYRDT